MSLEGPRPDPPRTDGAAGSSLEASAVLGLDRVVDGHRRGERDELALDFMDAYRRGAPSVGP